MVTTPSSKAMSLTPVQSAKAKAGISVNPLPISIPVAPVQLRNAPTPSRVTRSGRLMAARAVQPAKASRPMDTVLPRSKFVSALQSVKARSSISAAPLPRVRSVSPVQPTKASVLILVRLSVAVTCSKVVIPAKISPRFFTPFSRCTERTPACLYFQSWPFVK